MPTSIQATAPTWAPISEVTTTGEPILVTPTPTMAQTRPPMIKPTAAQTQAPTLLPAPDVNTLDDLEVTTLTPTLAQTQAPTLPQVDATGTGEDREQDDYFDYFGDNDVDSSI